MTSQYSNVNISTAVKNTLNDLNEHLYFAVFDTTSFASSMLPSADDKIFSAHLNLLAVQKENVFNYLLATYSDNIISCYVIVKTKINVSPHFI